MKKRALHIAIPLLLIAALLVFLLAAVLPFSISPAERADWLAAERAARLAPEGRAETSAALADSLTDGSLEFQLWQVEAERAEYCHAVVWQRGLAGNYRPVYTAWVPQTLLEEAPLSFGFRSGLYWYACRANRALELMEPVKTLRISP